MAQAEIDEAEYPEYVGCECEQDWNCPLHANRRGTWIETRYDGCYDGEPEWAQ